MKKLFFPLFIFFLAGCSAQKAGDQQTMTVALKPNITTLYYNGAIEPSEQRAVISKADGTIKKMYFEYGTLVAKDQLLFVIEAPQLVTDYQSALADYLKAQYQLTADGKKLQGSKDLYKLGIISDQDFEGDQSAYYNDVLSLAQAKQKLSAVLTKFDTPPVNIEQLSHLSEADTQKLTDMMAQSNTTLEIYAPTTGIAMPGDKSGGGNNNDSGDGQDSNLKPGSSVKAGQTIVNIGERTGIAVSIKVSELNINDIPTDQVATISGDAFPNITLQGHVSYKERLPISNNSSGGVPLYLVHIAIPKITPQQRETIRLGMSARAQINITQAATISVPLSAVFNQNGQSMIKVINPENKQIINTPVSTGATTEDSVTIQSGLKPGDVIVTDATTTTGN
jgi:HlyD family secretion protein